MDVSSSHSKNPAVAWDIAATAKAGNGEKIARAQIIVNDFPEFDKTFDPPSPTGSSNSISRASSRETIPYASL